MPRKSRFKLPRLDLGEESFGQRLARVRRERGYTQTELARKVGIIQALVSEYERDRVRLPSEMAVRFALALEVSTDELLGLKNGQGNGKRLPRRILRRLQDIESLRAPEQRALFKIIDNYVRGSRK